MGQECIVCTNKRNAFMIENDKTCASLKQSIDTKCHKNNNWTKNKFCQLSCFLAGNGYPGDVCCNDLSLSPSSAETSTPTVFPSVAPIEQSPITSSPVSFSPVTEAPVTSPPVANTECIICSNEGTPLMIENGRECASSSNSIKNKCNRSKNWTKNKYCQLSCYVAGNGYPGDLCCNTPTSITESARGE